MTGLIAVDWGTSNFRAYRLDDNGAVLDRVAAHDGMATVAAGGFPAILEQHAGAWMRQWPDAPVVMAGMVGARAGWMEAPYAPCPATPASLARAMARVTERVSIVPGVIARRGDIDADVMRGEETLVFGAGVAGGLVCQPGTHSKWVLVEDDVIVDFSTFMTGESYGLFRTQSLLSRLAAEPEDQSGFMLGLEAARDPSGLTNRLFQARARVLDGRMSGGQVGPYLSGLLIGAELVGAFARYGTRKTATLIADGVLARNYEAALEAFGVAVDTVTPETAFLRGLRRVARA